jgi:transcriptional antiterminator NusG
VPEIESIGENGRSRAVVQYRGYIFVECELNDVTKTIIRGTNRISRITETPLPDVEVRRLLGETVTTEEREINLGVDVGDEVDIIDGPFVSMTAKVVEIDTKNQKIKVGVMMFGRTNTVDLEFKQVKKAQIKSEDK